MRRLVEERRGPTSESRGGENPNTELRAGGPAGRPEASAAIWRWRADPGGMRQAAVHRKAGLVRAVVGSAVAVALFWLGRPTIAAVAGTLALLTGGLALFSPSKGYAVLDAAVARLARGVGLGLTWLLLAPAYFLVLTPLAWAIRLRRDPLHRTLERGRQSYWRERVCRPMDRPY